MSHSVRMPDGTIIPDVPDGTTQEELMARYQAYNTLNEVEVTAKRKPMPQSQPGPQKPQLPMEQFINKYGWHGGSGTPATPSRSTATFGDSLESARTMAQNAGAQALAGFSGMATMAAPMFGPMGGLIQNMSGNDTPANVVNRVANDLSHQPSEGAVRAMSESPLADFGAAMVKAGDWAGDKTLDSTGSPLLATGAKVGLENAAALVAPLARFGKYAAGTRAMTHMQTLARKATNMGYKLEPSSVRPGTMSNQVGLAGQPKLQHQLSRHNMGVTQRLANRDIGLHEGMPITRDSLNRVRAREGRIYQAVKGLGDIDTDLQTLTDLTNGLERSKAMVRRIPSIKNAELQNAYEIAMDVVTKKVPNPNWARGMPRDQKFIRVRNPTMDAKVAVEAISEIRNMASKAYKDGNTAAGDALRSVNRAIENSIERELARRGQASITLRGNRAYQQPSNILDDYRKARQTMAKTYDIEASMKDGVLDPSKLSTLNAKDHPLSGNLKLIAETAENFPTAMRVRTFEPSNVSKLDMFSGGTGAAVLAGGIASGNLPVAGIGAAGLVAPMVGPMIRARAMSNIPVWGGQSRMMSGPQNATPLVAGLLAQSATEREERRKRNEK